VVLYSQPEIRIVAGSVFWRALRLLNQDSPILYSRLRVLLHVEH
jgi:hypothetical protein